ncbi:MAG: sigma 54-interacting transcriptional regulator [Chromatiaceae bacterium]
MSESDSTTAQTISMPTRRLREIRLDCIELEVVSGSDAGMKRRLPLSIVAIGTAPDNDVVLTDRTVSRHHAQLRATPDGLLIRDLGSTNGIYLQGGRVVEAYLQPGDTCFLGDTEIAIKQETEERQYEVGLEDRLGALVGGSAPMRELYGMIKAVAPTSMTVLITGESGSGKEMVATTLHELSGRPGNLTVFDASVTDTEMMRNDLFGHVKGAFTGATAPRDGAFRRADGGTLFIDEIGELPLDLQPKLLRVLESREVVPVGSDRPHPVDVRVIAATHRDLEAMVEAGTFRADLYYRLSVITMRVPPLREILDDIPLLVQNFARRLNLGCRITPDALSELQRHAWPGNARELRNVLERATVLCQGGEIRPEHLLLTAARRDAPQAKAEAAATEPASSSSAQLKMLERQMIQDALARNGNNKAAAARALDMPLSTLKRRIAEFGL